MHTYIYIQTRAIYGIHNLLNEAVVDLLEEGNKEVTYHES
jgi:hypothetical protein